MSTIYWLFQFLWLRRFYTFYFIQLIITIAYWINCNIAVCCANVNCIKLVYKVLCACCRNTVVVREFCVIMAVCCTWLAYWYLCPAFSTWPALKDKFNFILAAVIFNIKITIWLYFRAVEAATIFSCWYWNSLCPLWRRIFAPEKWCVRVTAVVASVIFICGSVIVSGCIVIRIVVIGWTIFRFGLSNKTWCSRRYLWNFERNFF